MRLMLLATGIFALTNLGEPAIEAWMAQAFYPTLLLVLVIASLGVPIPEDVPLIAAGVLLKTHPGVASWPGTLFIAMVGIMFGDLVLYYIGKYWGPDVVNHRFVRWLITPRRFRKTVASFRRYGGWFCFFGRFVMGVRSVMCITAGATRFPYWRFFLADFCGALITVPLWILLGYWFADVLPSMQRWATGVKGVLAVAVAATIIGLIIYYKVRSYRRQRGEAGEPDPADEPIPGGSGKPLAKQPRLKREARTRLSKRAPAADL